MPVETSFSFTSDHISYLPFSVAPPTSVGVTGTGPAQSDRATWPCPNICVTRGKVARHLGVQPFLTCKIAASGDGAIAESGERAGANLAASPILAIAVAGGRFRTKSGKALPGRDRHQAGGLYRHWWR
jgi:hypothetical protein